MHDVCIYIFLRRRIHLFLDIYFTVLKPYDMILLYVNILWCSYIFTVFNMVTKNFMNCNIINACELNDVLFSKIHVINLNTL